MIYYPIGIALASCNPFLPQAKDLATFISMVQLDLLQFTLSPTFSSLFFILSQR